ncbi:MAG: DnaJ C-terminal domain-containing protein [Candidatus Dormibacteria bacterium]
MATDYKDYYKTLGVPRAATDKEIKSAFRKLARKSHPDLNPNDPGAEARFKEINEAHEVLADPEKRKKYDQFGAGWEHGGQAPSPFGGRGQQVEYRTMSAHDLESMFGTSAPFSDFFHSMFGSSGGAGPLRGAPAAKGSNVEGEVTITLEDAARGTATTIQLEGGGRKKKVEVKIPPGITDGARVRAAGQGAAGTGGGASGDLFVRVRVLPHPIFAREGNDLRVKVGVPLEVALLGGEVEVPTIKGTRVSLSVPAETQNGAVLRLRGLGMPHLGGNANGDLHALIDVRLPVPMSAPVREWAEGLKARL